MAEFWQTIGLGFAVPGIVTAATVLCLWRLFAVGAPSRYVLAGAFAAGLALGYLLLPSWADLFPQRHWQWLPYVGVAAGFIGGMLQVGTLAWLERALMSVLLTTVSAVLLVPNWESLQPARWIWCVGFVAYVVCLMLWTDRGMTTATASVTVLVLLMATAAVAVLTAAIVSQSYGQLAGVVTAAMAGCWIVTCWHHDLTMIRGWLPTAYLMLVGCALIGCVEPQSPLYGMLVVPLAPAFALVVDRLLAYRWTSIPRWWSVFLAGIVPIVAGAAWILVR